MVASVPLELCWRVTGRRVAGQPLRPTGLYGGPGLRPRNLRHARRTQNINVVGVYKAVGPEERVLTRALDHQVVLADHDVLDGDAEQRAGDGAAVRLDLEEALALEAGGGPGLLVEPPGEACRRVAWRGLALDDEVVALHNLVRAKDFDAGGRN